MLPASQNGYSYSHGNPVNYTDPSGLCIEGWPGGGVRMNQYPYGTSGICPNTLGPAGWILEAHAAMDDYYNSLPGDSLPFPICSVISPCRVINMGVTVVVVSSNSQGTPVEKWRSTAADILQWGQVGLDTFELCVSAASVIVEAGATGVAIPTTGPGAIIVNRLAVMGTDAFETTIGNVDLAANVTADFVGGNSYFDRRTNEWVFGQDTAATLLEQVTDAAIPSNKADILINVVALGYDVGKATGTISDFVEYRVPPLWIGGLPFPTLADPHPLGKGYFVIYAR